MEESVARALGQLYRDYRPAVVQALARAKVPASCRDDVTHEVFLVAARRLPTLEHGRTLAPWLVGVARKVALSYHRRVRRYTRRIHQADLPVAAPRPDDWLFSRRELHRLRRRFEDLDGRSRSVFVLRAVEGLSASEVAVRLGIDVQKVYYLSRRVRLALASPPPSGG